MLLGAAGPEVEIQTLGGESIAGALVEMTHEQVTLEADGNRQSIATQTLLGLSPKTPPEKRVWEPGVWVELADGTTLLGAEYLAENGSARITLAAGRTLEVATRDVVAVRFQRATEATLAQWSRIRDMETNADLLAVRKEEAVDYHRGLIRSVTDSAVQFEIDGEVLPVKRAKILGVVYFQPAGRQLPDALCRLADSDGCAWAVRTLGLSGDSLQWTTPLGLNVTRPLAEIARLDFSHGKVVYLSELEPELREWTPYFGTGKEIAPLAEFFAPKENRGMYGGPLELDGKSYSKGLALHSRTRLVYRLPDKFRRLKAVVGIDDRVRPRGNARLTIQGDDQVLLDTILDGTTPPQAIDLDLSGVRRLTILVDFGEDLDVSDHVDLCDIRVLK